MFDVRSNRGSYSFNGSPSKDIRPGSNGGASSEPPTPSPQVKLPLPLARRVPSTDFLSSPEVKYRTVIALANNNNNTLEDSRNTDTSSPGKSAENSIGCMSSGEDSPRISECNTGHGHKSKTTVYRLTSSVNSLTTGSTSATTHYQPRIGRSSSAFLSHTTHTPGQVFFDENDTFSRTSFCGNESSTPPPPTRRVSAVPSTSAVRPNWTYSLKINKRGDSGGIIPRSQTDECLISTDFTSTSVNTNSIEQEDTSRPCDSCKFQTIPRTHSKLEGSYGCNGKKPIVGTAGVESFALSKNNTMRDGKIRQVTVGSGSVRSSSPSHLGDNGKLLNSPPLVIEQTIPLVSYRNTNQQMLYETSQVSAECMNSHGNVYPGLSEVNGFKDNYHQEDLVSSHPFFSRMRDSAVETTIVSSKGTVRGVRNRVKAGIAVFVDKLDGKKQKVG